MVCCACGKESVDDFSFCPHCGNKRPTTVVCPSCARESAAEFSFCPHCGRAFATASPVYEPPPAPPLEVEAVDQERNEQPEPDESSATDRNKKIGTYVFGAFSVIALLVSIVKGIVPIYLLESAVWAGAAWYWHRKKKHSELATAIVIVCAGLLAIGEVVQIARQFRSEPKQMVASTPNPVDSALASQFPSAYSSPTASTAEALPATDFAEIEQRAVVLYKQKQYADARNLFDQACNGGETKACNYLGYFYAQGLGGRRDREKAQNIYQKACDLGTLSSCASLGSLYQDAGDDDNARKNFQKACSGGLAEACNLLRGIQ